MFAVADSVVDHCEWATVWAGSSGGQPGLRRGSATGDLDPRAQTDRIILIRPIVLCFLGIDGAGKTTIVKALQGGPTHIWIS